MTIGARSLLLLWMGLMLLAGCAGITSDLDPPKVSLVSVRSLPVKGETPQFEIRLRVINPNKQQLDIAGISYTVALLGKEIVAGVANDIAPIDGYGEGIVTLKAGLQMLELLRLVTSLGTAGSKPLDYRFTAKIDFNGFVPTQRIEETGQLTL
jgi:LEA14-like dessication related protein